MRKTTFFWYDLGWSDPLRCMVLLHLRMRAMDQKENLHEESYKTAIKKARRERLSLFFSMEYTGTESVILRL